MKSLRILTLVLAAWLAAGGVLLAQEPAPTPADESANDRNQSVAPADESAPATASQEATDAASKVATTPEPPPAPESPAVSEESGQKAETTDTTEAETEQEPKKQWDRRDEMVGVGQDIHLRDGERAPEFVVVFGDGVVDGKVDDNVVIVGGHVKINGPVGGNVVLVLSRGELGPDASVGGNAVVVGGGLENPHGITIRGNWVQPPLPNFGASLEWIQRGLVMGRPLVPSIRMTWIVAGAFLAFYLFIALILGRAVNATAVTLETRPGGTLLAALLFLPAFPLFVLILLATGIGVLVLPFVLVGLVFAAIFGKVAFLAFIGRAVLKPTANDKVSVAVLSTLIGGIIISLLYGVWYIGFALWALTLWIGIGMVVMTLVSAIRRERPKKVSAVATAPAAGIAPAPRPPPPESTSPAGSAAALSAPVSSGLADAPSEGQQATGDAAGASGFAEEHASTAQPPPVVPPVQPAPAPSAPTSPVGQVRAGFGIRIAAAAIDIVLIAGLCHLIDSSRAFALFFGLYTTLLWCFRATSVGGIICGLKIVRLDGRPVDFATAIVRTLGAYLSLLCVGLGFLWVIWDPEVQTWHDKIAGTTVIRVPKGMSLV